MFTGEVRKETKQLIQQCCEKQGLMLAMETGEDHNMHVFVNAPPRLSSALIAHHLKGYSSQFLHARSLISKVRGREHVWTSSYHAGAAGSVSAEIIKRYIEECQDMLSY